MTHPAIRELFSSVARHASIEAAAHQLRTGAAGSGPIRVSGPSGIAKALWLVLLWQAMERPLLVVTDGNREAEALLEAIDTFFALLIPGRDLPRPQLLPAFDLLPNQGLSPHAEICERRAIGLWRLSARLAPITVLPLPAMLARHEPKEFYLQLAQRLAVNEEVPLEDLIAHLESIGYERRDPVESVGDYSLRGGILDVFPPESSKPLRIEFYGDLIETIRRFDVESQRSVLSVESCSLLPLREAPKSRSLLNALRQRLSDGGVSHHHLPLAGDEFPGWELLAPLERGASTPLWELAGNPLVVWDEPEQIRGAAERLRKRFEASDRLPAFTAAQFYFDLAELAAAPLPRVELRELDLAPAPETLTFSCRPAPVFQGNLAMTVAETRNLSESGTRVVFFAAATGEMERLADVFHEYGLAYQLGVEPGDGTPAYLAERAYFAGSAASVFLTRGALKRGIVLAEPRIAIFGSDDLFEPSELVAQPSVSKAQRAFSADLLDLKPGDFVVHSEHGVGRFLGLREINQGDTSGEFMLIEYSGGSKLYLPLTRMDLVQRFRGAGESAPQLDRLGGATWTKTKTRVKARMRDMAEELLKLYAKRKMAEGFSFSPDSNWQREFEDAFPWDLTRDQAAATKEIKRDMESEQPMDRLLCGDVGFGKTEVVMRAAFKALGDGKQVAVLAPTTVLCFQHFETFKRRFQPFPARVEMLSRFRSPKELKQVVADIAEGKVDVAIGTHRLLSNDVIFRDLGLLIIDEEQRFGVRHKEKLKQMRSSVDVVAMSATPIPRTLHMSLLGLRDMSVIETPPKDRLAIQTVVAHYDAAMIKSAIELELGRGGQVYFVHNRIDSIFMRAASLQELVPSAKIAVGHGQMGEEELERTMLGFMRRDFDILVSTTIVENGLDIPLANTMIIENAERYGLSELYQLRGRVGRSNRRAYAYLLVPMDTELSEIARKRLAALREFSDLGAGFKIAALDLELRGAGNLLGGEQSGQINAVGFDVYVRLLEESVRELRGEEVTPEIHASLNLGLDIRVPQDYIGDENQRLRAYKRIAEAPGAGERDAIRRELEDRYGPLPEQLDTLFGYSEIKTLAENIGIEAMDRKHDLINVKFHKQATLAPEKLMALVQQTPGAQFTPAGVLRVPLGAQPAAAAVIARLRQILSALLA